MLEIKIKKMKDQSKIPKGFYCYDTNGVCPYWSINKNKSYQNNGYCSYLKQGGWEYPHFGLLWDQVKDCNINTEDDLEYEE